MDNQKHEQKQRTSVFRSYRCNSCKTKVTGAENDFKKQPRWISLTKEGEVIYNKIQSLKAQTVVSTR